MTRTDIPVQVMFVEEHQAELDAIRRENQIKKWSRAKKLALVSGDWDRLKALSRSHAAMSNSGHTLFFLS